MSITNFPHGVSSYGVPVIGSGSIPATKGTVFFVDYGSGSDGNDGLTISTPFKTLAYAYSKTTTNMDDVIVLMGSSAHTLTAMLSITKNRVHFIGLDGTPGRHFGQNARVVIGVTTDTANVSMIQNTGVRNSFHNIKFDSGDSLTQAVTCFGEGGEFTLFTNCHFYKSTHLSTTTATELLLNGDSCQFYNCTFGSLVNEVADNSIRPNVRLAREVITGKVCRDCYFENCLFLTKAGGTEAAHVYAAGATDVERILMFKDCTFIGAQLGATLPADAVDAAAAQTEGIIFLKNCSSVNCSAMVEASSNIFVDGAVPTFATTGKAVEA